MHGIVQLTVCDHRRCQTGGPDHSVSGGHRKRLSCLPPFFGRLSVYGYIRGTDRGSADRRAAEKTAVRPPSKYHPLRKAGTDEGCKNGKRIYRQKGRLADGTV